VPALDLRNLSVAERRRIGDSLDSAMPELSRVATEGETRTLRALSVALRNDRLTAAAVRSLLPQLTAFAAPLATSPSAAAIQFEDGRSQAWLDRNTILGAVVLYGRPGEARVNQDIVAKLRGELKDGP
jgi:hypothetical protein